MGDLKAFRMPDSKKSVARWWCSRETSSAEFWTPSVVNNLLDYVSTAFRIRAKWSWYPWWQPLKHRKFVSKGRRPMAQAVMLILLVQIYYSMIASPKINNHKMFLELSSNTTHMNWSIDCHYILPCIHVISSTLSIITKYPPHSEK